MPLQSIHPLLHLFPQGVALGTEDYTGSTLETLFVTPGGCTDATIKLVDDIKRCIQYQRALEPGTAKETSDSRFLSSDADFRPPATRPLTTIWNLMGSGCEVHVPPVKSFVVSCPGNFGFSTLVPTDSQNGT